MLRWAEILASDEDIKRAILRKMIRQKFIEGRHTSIDNLPKGFPPSKKGQVKNVVERMVKERYFILNPKRDSLHVSLNPKMLLRIKMEIRSEN